MGVCPPAHYTGWRLARGRNTAHSERPERLNPARRLTAPCLPTGRKESGEERSGGSHGTYQDRRGQPSAPPRIPSWRPLGPRAAVVAAQNDGVAGCDDTAALYPRYWKRPPIS